MRIEEVVRSSDRPAINIGRLYAVRCDWKTSQHISKMRDIPLHRSHFQKPNKYNLLLNRKYEMHLT